jgi:hypothetical protein
MLHFDTLREVKGYSSSLYRSVDSATCRAYNTSLFPLQHSTALRCRFLPTLAVRRDATSSNAHPRPVFT